MPAGLQVYGDHGVLQIDELYRNMALRASGTFNNNDTVVFANAVMPILAVRTTHSDGALQIGKTMSGSTATFGFKNPVVNGNWWIFDVPAQVANVGFQVFDAAGALVFDTDNDYMRMIGGPHIIDDSPTDNYTEPSGKTHAWIQVDSGLYEQWVGGTQVNQFGYSLYYNASKQLQVAAATSQIGGRSGTSAPGFVRWPQVLVLDVTGM